MHSKIPAKILAVAAGTAFALTSFAADALPVTPVAGAAAPQITRVAEGCGAGMVRGPAGGCRPGRVVRPVVVVPARPVVVVKPVRPVVVVKPPRAVVVAPRRGGCGIRVPGVAIVTPC